MQLHYNTTTDQLRHYEHKSRALGIVSMLQIAITTVVHVIDSSDVVVLLYLKSRVPCFSIIQH
jgi:hypothetical protein